MSSIFPASSLIIPEGLQTFCAGDAGAAGAAAWRGFLLLSLRFCCLGCSGCGIDIPRRQDKISDGVGGNTSCCWLSQCSYSAVGLNVKSLKDPLVVVIWPQADYLNNLLSFPLVTSHEEWDLSEERSRHPLDHPISLICEMRSSMAALFWGLVGVLPHPKLVCGTCQFWRSLHHSG